MYIGVHVNYPLYLLDWKFLERFLKNIQISNFMKIRQVEAYLFHADRRTDITKLKATFHNFSNPPKND